MFGWISRNLIIDLGSYKTVVYSVGEGIVFNEPTCIVFRKSKGKEVPIKFGLEAWDCLGRLPENSDLLFPVRNGVVTNFKVAQIYLSHIFSKLGKSFIFPYANKIFVVVPSFLSDVEKRTFIDLFAEYAKTVKLISANLANSLALSGPVQGVKLIVDIGGGKTEIAVLSSTDTVFISSIRVGGFSVDEAIVNFVKREFLFQLGELSAERLKKSTLSLVPELDTVPSQVRGMNLESGLPASITLSSQDLRQAVFDVINLIKQGILLVLESSPPELAGEIVSSGINLCGGGAYMRGLSQFLQKELQVKTQVIPNSHIVSVFGAAQAISEPTLESLI